jgi:hypothetical protein
MKQEKRCRHHRSNSLAKSTPTVRKAFFFIQNCSHNQDMGLVANSALQKSLVLSGKVRRSSATRLQPNRAALSSAARISAVCPERKCAPFRTRACVADHLSIDGLLNAQTACTDVLLCLGGCQVLSASVRDRRWAFLALAQALSFKPHHAMPQSFGLI